MKFPLLKIIALAFLFSSGIAFAQTFDVEKVTYANQDLRELGSIYLGNPNYWEAILKYSNVESVSDLKRGHLLLVPVGLIKATNEITSATLKTIKSATENGAKIFTAELLENAQQKYNSGIEHKKAHNWKDAHRSISEALTLAGQALEQSQLLRRQSADATISFRKGDVQNRTPRQRVWREAPLFTKLFEEDRTRTLRNSYAEITFLDLSRVRLNENSQALIQRSKLDVLKNATDTKVRLIKGDAFAYLQKSPKKKFDIDIPGLDTRIKSKSFWIEKEDRSTKIANYEGEIELKAGNKTVLVKENQGSVIPKGAAPSEPKDLLPSPVLIEPENSKQFFKPDLRFEWKGITDASYYWFEVAQDKDFKKLVYSTKTLSGNNTTIKSFDPGVYYWRVASIDQTGFPGKFSTEQYIHIIKDEHAPYLYITSPARQVISTNPAIMVSGETEQSCKVLINNIPVIVDRDGTFSKNIQLSEGYNKVFISSSDKAGNTSHYFSNVLCEVNENVELEIKSSKYHPNTATIITNTNLVSVEGITRPLSSVEIKLSDGGKEYRAYADTSGLFNCTINVAGASEQILLHIVSPAGYTRTDTMNLLLDMESPVINLTERIPERISKREFTIRGSVTESEKVFINEKLVDTNFSHKMLLNEGDNSISIRAKDKAGNLSIIERVVTLDTSPPKLIKYTIEKMHGKNNMFKIYVSAEDPAGLKKAITVKLDNNGKVINEILRLDENLNRYEGIVSIDSSDQLKLSSITLEDYLNNSKTYFIK